MNSTECILQLLREGSIARNTSTRYTAAENDGPTFGKGAHDRPWQSWRDWPKMAFSLVFATGISIVGFPCPAFPVSPTYQFVQGKRQSQTATDGK